MRLVVILLTIGLSGCASFDRKALEEAGLWPSRTKTWCGPRVSYSHKARRTSAGVRCWY